MRQLLGLLILGLLLTTCRNDLILYEKEEFRGKVVLTDSFLEAVSTPAPEATVYLANNPQAVPYLYSIKADAEGIFKLPYQPEKDTDRKGLKMVGKFTDKAGLTYQGWVELVTDKRDNNGDYRVSLIPQYPGGIIKVTVQNNSTNKEPVSGAEVHLFTSNEQAQSFSVTASTGVVPPMTTNEKGIAFFYNLRSATYYVVAKAGTRYTNQESKLVDADMPLADKMPTSVTVPLFLQTVKGSLLVRVTDAPPPSGQPLAKLAVYLFSSKLQAESITGSAGVKGDVGMILTTAQGEALFNNLDAGIYFVGVAGDLPPGKLPYVNPASATVVAGQTAPIPIVLP